MDLAFSLTSEKVYVTLNYIINSLSSHMKMMYAFFVIVLLFTLCVSPTWSQTNEVVAARKAVNNILEIAGGSFKEGLLAYEQNKLPLAAERFNRSVEFFLYSNVSLELEPKLDNCYKQLIETVYRIEYPSDSQLPQIRNVSQTCAWNIDTRLADKITDLVKNSLQKPLSRMGGLAGLNRKQTGFNSQEFEPSPLDELSKIELTPDETLSRSNLPVRTNSTYLALPSSAPTILVVKAKAGDTVAQIAARNGVNVKDVAIFNGLLPDSRLEAGREIKIPKEGEGETWQSISKRTGVKVSDLMTANPGMAKPRGKVFVPVANGKIAVGEAQLIGPKPVQSKDGKIGIILKYFDEVLNDPYSMRIVSWSEITKISLSDGPYWRVFVKYRAKNTFGAYVLSESVFYIRKGKIASTFRIS